MNQLLAKALDEMSKPPPAEQEALGAILLEELELRAAMGGIVWQLTGCSGQLERGRFRGAQG